MGGLEVVGRWTGSNPSGRISGSEFIASRAVDKLLLHTDTFGMNVVLRQSCTRT